MAQSDNDDLISLIEDDDAISEIPTSLPLLPVRDVVVFCDMVLPLFVGRDKSIRAVEEGVAKDGFLMLATQKDPAIENPAADDIYAVGTVSRVLRMLKLPDGRVKALVQGVAKAKISRYLRKLKKLKNRSPVRSIWRSRL
jgi:ATP-dependent Lon protease